MIDEMPPIRRLHGLYQDASGLLVSLSMPRIEMWRIWMSKGWLEEDLKLTMRMLIRKAEGRVRILRVFRFEYFIGMPERFEEDLAEARALARVRHENPGKAAVLRATHRPVQQFFGDAKPIGDVMAADAAFREFLKLKETL